MRAKAGAARSARRFLRRSKTISNERRPATASGTATPPGMRGRNRRARAALVVVTVTMNDRGEEFVTVTGLGDTWQTAPCGAPEQANWTEPVSPWNGVI